MQRFVELPERVTGRADIQPLDQMYLPMTKHKTKQLTLPKINRSPSPTKLAIQEIKFTSPNEHVFRVQ
jgi:hypothetical protein